MRLRQLYEAIRHGRSARCDHRQPWQQVGEVEAAVETPAEFSEVAGQMLVSDGMVGSMHSVLDITEHGVNPFESATATQAARSADDDGFVATARLAHSAEATQPVGAHLAAG